MEQKVDLELVAGKNKGFGVLDFVTCWYFKAADYIDGTSAEVALVSTNSITQGEQVSVLWGGLAKYNLKINFAHRTFKWSNEGKGVAAVHCVIVGFSQRDRQKKYLYNYTNGIDSDPVVQSAKQINAYLVDADWVLVTNRSRQISAVKEMAFGSMPNDGGNLLLSNDEKIQLLNDCPGAKPYVKKLIGSEEYINGIDRWCLWLVGLEPSILRSMPEVMTRVQRVRAKRLQSTRPATNKLADSPSIFGELRQPISDYLAFPEVSSERRLFVPIGFVDKDVVSTNKIYTLENASLFDFGVLASSLHMAWLRVVGGRLKSDYQYSAGIVYNNFVWPKNVPDAQLKAVEATAKAILGEREKFANSSLADLYDPLTMPIALVKAHEANDRAVDKAYGYKGTNDDAARAAHLFKLYNELNSLLPAASKKRAGKIAG